MALRSWSWSMALVARRWISDSIRRRTQLYSRVLARVRSLADLAGDKLLALFARAASRDFVDVSALLEHFSREEMLRLAVAKDRGFSPEVLADAFRVFPTYDRADEFPSLSDDAYARLLATFAAWDTELRSGAAGS